VVYFGEDNAEFKTFQTVAGNFDDIKFFHTHDAALKTGSTVTLFKDFDEGKNDFAGEFTAENLEKFVDDNSIKTIMFFDEKAAEIIFSNSKNALFVLYGEDPAQAQPFQKVMEDASTDLKGKVVMSDSKITEGLGSRLAEFLGVETTASPRFMMITFANDDVQKFTMETAATKENVVKFVTDVLSGAIKPFLKSAEIPTETDEAVKTIVGKTFNDVVINSNDNVFIEMYAPWCGHCKTLLPIFEELGALAKNIPNLTIGKFDATANEAEGVSVKSFPTIFLYKAGSKNAPIPYEGGRDLESFKKYLTEQLGTQWDAKPANEDL